MPFFAHSPLRKLAIFAGTADVELDARGMSEEEARSHLAAVIAHGLEGGTARFTVRFDPARGDGRETLFQPLGRMLLEARRAGRVSRCLPLPEGDGYYFELAPRP